MNRFIFQVVVFGHIFVYSVVTDTPRHARTLIKKAMLAQGGSKKEANGMCFLLQIAAVH